MTVYVYQDRDHDEIEVFDSLKKAKDYTKKQWGHNPVWDRYNNGFRWHDIISDYVTIYKLEVK